MNKENKKVGFSLQGIKTEQFAIFEDHFNPKKETNLGTELQFKLNHSNKQVGVFIGFEFLQSKRVFLKIVISCHFKINDESWKTFIHEGSSLIIPKGFLSHLAMIATGTARGVLFAKTEGSQFSKFILPTINVVEMIEEDAVFDLANE